MMLNLGLVFGGRFMTSGFEVEKMLQSEVIDKMKEYADALGKMGKQKNDEWRKKWEKILNRETWHDWSYASLQVEPTPITA